MSVVEIGVIVSGIVAILSLSLVLLRTQEAQRSGGKGRSLRVTDHRQMRLLPGCDPSKGGRTFTVTVRHQDKEADGVNLQYMKVGS